MMILRACVADLQGFNFDFISKTQRFKKITYFFSLFRLSPDKNTLIWLERDLHNRSHACILRLMGLDLQGNQKPRTVVETKQLFKPDTDDFAGMNQRTYDLPKRCFINNDEIIFSDVVIDVMVPFKCNIKVTLVLLFNYLF